MILCVMYIWVLFKVHLSPQILNTTSYHLRRLLRVNLSRRIRKSPFNNCLLRVSAHDCQQMIYALFYPTKSHNSFFLLFFFKQISLALFAVDLNTCRFDALPVWNVTTSCRKCKMTAACSALKRGLFVTEAQVIRGQFESGSPQHQRGRTRRTCWNRQVHMCLILLRSGNNVLALRIDNKYNWVQKPISENIAFFQFSTFSRQIILSNESNWSNLVLNVSSTRAEDIKIVSSPQDVIQSCNHVSKPYWLSTLLKSRNRAQQTFSHKQTFSHIKHLYIHLRLYSSLSLLILARTL